ncbi:MAG: ABC transporter ATP-binding protein [Planctomycetota bacterium]|nr:ABC transporter ATP-binding protein [Planctomycetaceae bacterium]MDQ3331063.1 ABC transporter ATP-binding protein [Planctomycetota bacterium]
MATTFDALQSATSTATAPAIEIRRLSHVYKNHRALVDVSLRVESGSIHGFVGPNGAGKTTSLKLICTLLKPQTGTVRVFGHDVLTEMAEVRRKIGFMPDHFSMYRQMTVHEYLDFFAAAYGLPPKDRDRVIGDVLALTDMDHRREDLIQGLSRGMQQRVGLARVLVNDPQLLLLDEPASGLDPRARIELMDILRELRSMGKTIFISSHILSELAELCDSVTIIDRGVTKFSGPIEDLLAAVEEHPTYRFRFGNDREGLAEDLAAIFGVVSVEPVEGELASYRVAYDWTKTTTNDLLAGALSLGLPVVEFTRAKRHLNEAFMDLTERGVR